jgi:hypothetical protein
MSTETTKAPSLETQVAEWSATESALREAVEATKGITVAEHAEGPKKGREAVHSAMMVLAVHRTSIEVRRKELKAPILALGTLVDSEAKRLTAITAPREAELRADRDAYDAEQAKIAAAVQAEKDRLAALAAEQASKALQAKIDRVASLGGAPNLAQLQLITDDAFDVLCSELAEVQAAKIAREAQEKADREEAERIAREQREAKEAEERRAQAEQREKDAAERKRLLDIEDARLEKERAELRKEREAQEAERRRLDAEADKIRRDKEAEESRVRREQERKEAEAEAERERIEAAEREAAEAARIEAEKPDREKISAWAKAWAGAEPKHPQIASQALRANLERASEDVLHLLNLLAGAEGGGE